MSPSPRSQAAARRRRRRRAPAAAVLALVTAGSAACSEPSGPPEAACPEPRALRVAASPDVAPVLTDLLAPGGPPETGACDRVEVSAVPPHEVAAAATSPAPGADLPDVWIPDSSAWLRGVDVTGPAPSLATSPVVLAATGPAAGLPDVAALLALGTEEDEGDTRLVLAPPRASVPAAATVAALTAEADRAPELRPGVTRTLRQAVPTRTGNASTLLAALTPDHVVPVAEQAVWTHNAAAPPSDRVTALYLDAAAVLDYPFAVLAPAGPVRDRAAELLDLLTSPAGATALASNGFRDAGGAFGPDPAAPPGVDPGRVVGATPADPALPQGAADTLTTLGLGSRMLALIDLSGSMAAHVDGGPRRIDLVAAAASSALATFPAGSSVGLWAFTTGDGQDDVRRLVPVGPLDEVVGGVPRASLLAAAVEGMEPVDFGGTPLYDATLAAVREVRAGWDPRRVNSVVLLSDGRNEDDDSITLEVLLQTLAEEADPARPVPVITIAYGPDADAAVLAQIADATGGATYRAPEPHQIGGVFLDAVGRRVCRPDC